MIIEVQQAIFAKVSGIANLGAEVFEVWAPQDQPLPMVCIEPIRTSDNSTDTELNAFTATFQIHVWSESKSSLETATIQKKIYDNLHLVDDLNPVGYSVSIIRQEESNIDLDPDGITRHGVQIYSIVFEPPQVV